MVEAKTVMEKRIKIDLHTHSEASPDGALTTADYRRILENDLLDYIAVTDHNRTDFAFRLRDELEDLGDRIIIGEEIRTTHGEIIGLYLKETVPPHMTPQETVDAIHAQGGLVCIPHPFETVRQGIQPEALELVAADVDIIEVHNGRAVFQNKSKQAYAWMALHNCTGAANSDCHAPSGWGRTRTRIAEAPTRRNLLGLLREAEYDVAFPGVKAVLYPKLNRLRKGNGLRRRKGTDD